MIEQEQRTKIHLGCGKRNFGPDWIHIDGSNYPHVDSNNIRRLLYEDNSMDLLYASHVIAYFDRQEIVNVLTEWRRVLKPNGILRLATPDFRTMIRLYNEHNIPLQSFVGPLYGRMQMGNETIYHKTCYDKEDLTSLLLSVGFDNVREWDWRDVEHGIHDDHSQAYIPHMDKDNGTLISLNIECNKQ